MKAGCIHWALHRRRHGRRRFRLLLHTPHPAPTPPACLPAAQRGRWGTARPARRPAPWSCTQTSWNTLGTCRPAPSSGEHCGGAGVVLRAVCTNGLGCCVGQTFTGHTKRGAGLCGPWGWMGTGGAFSKSTPCAARGARRVGGVARTHLPRDVELGPHQSRTAVPLQARHSGLEGRGSSRCRCGAAGRTGSAWQGAAQ